jgi:hypothetical protein
MTADRLGPVTVDGVRGWPMPDCSGDACSFDLAYRGWLPWAIVPDGPDWYVGLYGCDHGHVWACGYGMVAHPDDPGLRQLRVSPVRTLPSAETLVRMGLPRSPKVSVIDWRPLREAVRT